MYPVINIVILCIISGQIKFNSLQSSALAFCAKHCAGLNFISPSIPSHKSGITYSQIFAVCLDSQCLQTQALSDCSKGMPVFLPVCPANILNICTIADKVGITYFYNRCIHICIT